MQKDETELMKMAGLATSIQAEFKKLYEYMQREKPSAFIAEYESQKLNDACDMLASIEAELRAKCDGRPQPITRTGNVVASTGGLEKASYEWACCDEPGYREMATISDVALTRNELVELRTWIDEVLKWHEQMAGQKYE